MWAWKTISSSRKACWPRATPHWSKKIVALADMLNRDVATPDDARRILGLKGRDMVNF